MYSDTASKSEAKSLGWDELRAKKNRGVPAIFRLQHMRNVFSTNCLHRNRGLMYQQRTVLWFQSTSISLIPSEVMVHLSLFTLLCTFVAAMWGNFVHRLSSKERHSCTTYAYSIVYFDICIRVLTYAQRDQLWMSTDGPSLYSYTYPTEFAFYSDCINFWKRICYVLTWNTP